MRIRFSAALLAVSVIFASCGAEPLPGDSSAVFSPEAKYEYATGYDHYVPVPDTEASTEALPALPYELARISFLASGDNLIHPCIYMDAKDRATKETGEYNFRPMFDDVDEFIASFDIAFANQETPMGGANLGYSGYPNFNSPQDLGRDLRDIGYDVISIANNHMLDKREAGLAGTIEFFESEEMSDVLLIGGYKNEADYNNIRIFEKNGVKIAFLAYTYGTNGITLPASSEYVVPYIDDDDIIRQCAFADGDADLTVVSIHWGEENTTKPTDEQKRLAKLLNENGVDVILGHHPHVLQPIEWIESEAGTTLCAYSLGNLLSAMMYWENMVGGFLTFDIVKMSDGDIFIDNPAFVPTAFFYGPSYYNSHLYFLCDYPEDVAKNHGTGRLYGSPAAPHDMLAYANRLLGDFLETDPEAVK